MNKVNVAILGTGNVGTDLLIKVQHSKFLECSLFAGIRKSSKGIQLAKKLGIKTSTNSIASIVCQLPYPKIVFDATTAKAHKKHAPILKDMTAFAIDLTPSKIGKMCIPSVNLKECLREPNVNMVSCGGQAIVPLAHAIMQVCPETEYMEVISSMASKSAGMGTRNNIDEFTQTTADVLKEIAGVPKAKAIIILNPAEPSVTMQNTLYCEISNPNTELLKKKVEKVVAEIKEYVPGYKLVLGPVYEKEQGRLTVSIKCKGQGDYLPKYAGNLDIITCAAVKVAEEYVKKNSNY